MNLIMLASFVDVLKSIGNIVLDILMFVIVLGLIVGIHELGHFIFARKAGVLCREYAIGMGPRLWKKKKGETVYSIRAFPIGGFCAIAGEEVEGDPFAGLKTIKLDIVGNVIKGFYPETENEKYDFPLYNIISYDIYDEKQTGNLFMEVEQDGVTTIFKVDPQAIIYTTKDEFQIAPYNRTLGQKSKTARALVMFGGPLMNFVLALVAFFIVGLVTCFPNNSSPYVGDVNFGNSISEYYQKTYTKEELLNLDLNDVFSVQSPHVSEIEVENKDDITEFLNEYTSYIDKNKVEETDEVIYVIHTRATYLTKDDKITLLSTTTLGEKKIEAWTDVTNYMKEYDDKLLCEEITIKFERDDKEYVVYSKPFIRINSLGIGSGWYYDFDKPAVIKAYDDISNRSSGLGDNSQIKLGDTIIKLGDIENPTWYDIRKVFDAYTGDAEDDTLNWIDVTVKRLNTETNEYEELPVKVKPYSKELMMNQTSLDGASVTVTDATVGFSPKTKFSIIKSIGYAFEGTGSSFMAVFDTLKLLANKTVSIKNLSGPIGIFSITGEARSAGLIYVIRLIGLLSVNIGLLNLFPIPALDGGRLVFVAYEAITRKKPNPKVETILITVTLVLLLILMVFVAYEDILRLF